SDQIVTIHGRHEFANRLSDQSLSSKVAFIKEPSFVPADGTVRRVVETANSAVIDVESLGRSFLVMSVTPHKYWHITLDGRAVKAIITNIGYQGIVIPAGTHRVVMRYRNDLVVIGLWISSMAIVVFLAMIAVTWRRAF